VSSHLVSTALRTVLEWVGSCQQEELDHVVSELWRQLPLRAERLHEANRAYLERSSLTRSGDAQGGASRSATAERNSERELEP